jgi:hypothetical protein
MAGNFHNNFRFAMLGLSITALFVVYQLLTEPGVSRDHLVMIGFIVLCPPSLLSLPFIDVEVGTRPFYFLWALIGLLNASLYGLIFALARRWKKSA